MGLIGHAKANCMYFSAWTNSDKTPLSFGMDLANYPICMLIGMLCTLYKEFLIYLVIVIAKFVGNKNVSHLVPYLPNIPQPSPDDTIT